MSNAARKKAFYLALLSLPLSYHTASAGFEFTAPTAVPARPATAEQAQALPMPIVETPSVTAMSLTPEPGQISPPPREVYIKREKITTAIQPSANEAYDSDGLLAAVQNNRQISVVESDGTISATNGGNASSSRLVINPYPLQAEASHALDDGIAAVDQGMMEQTGYLRPVLTPGQAQGSVAVERTQARSNQTASRNPIFISNRADVSAPSKNIMQNAVEAAPLDTITPIAVQQPAPSAPIAPPQTQSVFTDAVGFGRDLPLALALSQVVPPSYSYGFAQSVDTGAIVSWQGGKSWDKVLNDMLAPIGMKAIIQDNQVFIQAISG